MANNEDIIIIDENDTSDTTIDQNSQNESTSKQTIKSNKKLFIIIGILLLVTTIIIVILFKVLKKDDKFNDFSNLNEKLKPKKEPIKVSSLEKLISKANYLYANNQKEHALKLYEQIADYSEGISLYNLGVAQLKDKQYKLARSSFIKALKNQNNSCPSAINAAVCSLYLKDKKSFDYYIKLANSFLPLQGNKKLYSTYYSLINYYIGNYYEALSALKHPTSDTYKKDSELINAKISTLNQDYFSAITQLSSRDEARDAFTLASLYCNVGDLAIAKTYLEEAIKINPKPIKEQLSLVLVLLKMGQTQKAGELLKTITSMYPDDIYNILPIKVGLKKSILDPDTAQKMYRENIINSHEINIQLILYYAPYKVFNANTTISYIRKGNANIYIDDVQSAKNYLKRSATTSKTNLKMAQAIKDALTFNLRRANKTFIELVKEHPKHSILLYNLALTYMHLGDIVNAHKYFLKSYNLNTNNYLSGVFALMSANLLGIKHKKMSEIFRENLASEDESEKFELIRVLLDLSEKNYVASIHFLDKNLDTKSIYLVINTIISMKYKRYELAQKYSKKLKALNPNEIIASLIDINTQFHDLGVKAYARATIEYLKNENFHYQDLYYGTFLTRYLYLHTALQTGQLYFIRESLKNILANTNKSPADILQSLALASIFDKQFEEAYNYYNTLIDQYKIRDSRTLFLAAIASIGADHHANAIALLELAKLKDKKNYESRYALGLLQLEVKNHNSAGTQFSLIRQDSFISRYFTFNIDTQKLLFKKNPELIK